MDKTFGLSQSEIETILSEEIKNGVIANAEKTCSVIAKAIVANNKKIIEDIKHREDQFMQGLKRNVNKQF